MNGRIGCEFSEDSEACLGRFCLAKVTKLIIHVCRRRQSKSSDREAVRVSIRESHMSSENRVCGCSGQYQRMQRGKEVFFTAHMAVPEIYPVFYRKRRWWLFFCIAQRSSLESRWLYILEDSNSTWIFIVSRLQTQQNRKQRWGGIANTKAKWVKWFFFWWCFFPWFSRATKKITSLTGPRWTNLLQIWKSQGLVFRKFSLSYHGWPGEEVEDDHPGNHFKTPVMDAFNLRFPRYRSCPTLSCKTSAFQHWGQGLQWMSCQMA